METVWEVLGWGKHRFCNCLDGSTSHHVATLDSIRWVSIKTYMFLKLVFLYFIDIIFNFIKFLFFYLFLDQMFKKILSSDAIYSRICDESLWRHLHHKLLSIFWRHLLHEIWNAIYLTWHIMISLSIIEE